MTKNNNRQSTDLKKQEKYKQKQNIHKYKKLKVEEIVKLYNKKTDNLEGKVTSGRNVDNETEQVFTNDDQMKDQNSFNNENLSDIIVNETIEEGHAELDNMSQTKSPSIIPESDSEDDVFAETRHGHVNANVEIIRNDEDGDSDSIALSANNKHF
ncbi:uncharacterized protein LOC123266068 [Cotesia glomerata]|uniref:uncharacterized protein LOC123266068 n=1 Tax=Cotesia glomerata TaxID=32391 RepID=UPI001D02DEFE|nr:uncharacterized protein LOC123266068 [Cotesia glomerata]